MRMIPCRAVWLFADEAKMVSEAAAPFNWGEVQGINIHSIWVLDWTRSLWAMGESGLWVLWGWSLMHEGNFSSYFPLESEMGGFLIPSSNGGGDVVHGLDLLHNPYWNASQEVGDQSGGIFDFIILGADYIQFELVDVLLELFSSGDAGSGKPVHGFLLDIGVPEGFLKVGFEGNESPKGLVGETLLAMYFGPHGSRPFLHVGQGISNLPVIVMVDVTIEDPPTSFSPFSTVDCTMLNHFSFNNFIAVAFPDLARDLDIQI